MKPFDWNEEKNRKLKEEMDISFEEVINAIENGGLLDEIANPNKEKYETPRAKPVVSGETVSPSILFELASPTGRARGARKFKNSSQKMCVVEIDSYVYLVPFIEDKEKIFLKTVFPSRMATRKYLIKGNKK